MLAAFAGTGIVIGLVIVYYWDQILDFFGIGGARSPVLAACRTL